MWKEDSGKGVWPERRENMGHTKGEMRTGLISAERTHDGGISQMRQKMKSLSSAVTDG